MERFTQARPTKYATTGRRIRGFNRQPLEHPTQLLATPNILPDTRPVSGAPDGRCATGPAGLQWQEPSPDGDSESGYCPETSAASSAYATLPESSPGDSPFQAIREGFAAQTSRSGIPFHDRHNTNPRATSDDRTTRASFPRFPAPGLGISKAGLSHDAGNRPDDYFAGSGKENRSYPPRHDQAFMPAAGNFGNSALYQVALNSQNGSEGHAMFQEELAGHDLELNGNLALENAGFFTGPANFASELPSLPNDQSTTVSCAAAAPLWPAPEKRRKTKYDPQKREKVYGVRKSGACLRCHVLKEGVSAPRLL